MELTINPETVKFREVSNLASPDLVEEIASLLDLEKQLHDELQNTLAEIYHDFLDGYYNVKNSIPEHEQINALMNVSDIAYSLITALNNLVFLQDTDKRLTQELEKDDVEGIWRILRQKAASDNPNLYLRKNIASLCNAAKRAADGPDRTKERIIAIRAAITAEDNLKKKEDLEGTLALEKWYHDMHPDREEERKTRAKKRKIPKDLPIRASVQRFKVFFDAHIDHPFTAGKYYSEIGFKSPAFYAVKTVLKRIYPKVSDRKIASLMQEL